MEILPKIGLGDIKLGMSMDQVRCVLGDPDKIEVLVPVENKPESRDVNWFYGNTEYCFCSEDNFLLGSIQSSCVSLTLDKSLIMGISSKELKARFPSVRLDDEFDFEIDEYRDEGLQLSFWVKGGAVDLVTIYPEYNAEGNKVLWPG